ncbi:hypothetical protein Celaphus_00008743 [Cervus elaphus hippelaphus]|uniref:Uncharacterized protein n=1 Tax=Cervus elaphus hippelaphus TaxID=46360 RepID=A0A212CPE4_CEREH|nr:hypothetical protein Celaphus_00008743 [Cervus elaphus hippelaphus]
MAGSLWGHTVCCFQNQSWTDTLLRWIYLETSGPSVPLRGGESSQSRPDGISARSQLRGAGREASSKTHGQNGLADHFALVKLCVSHN